MSTHTYLESDEDIRDTYHISRIDEQDMPCFIYYHGTVNNRDGQRGDMFRVTFDGSYWYAMHYHAARIISNNLILTTVGYARAFGQPYQVCRPAYIERVPITKNKYSWFVKTNSICYA